MARKVIPESVQTSIMDRSGGYCTICYGTRKCSGPAYPHVQIAHIDRNHENNSEDNLALLCLICHNLYDSRFSQTKNYRPGNIKKWRDELYRDYANRDLKLDCQSYSNIPVIDEEIEKLRAFCKKSAIILSSLCDDGTCLSTSISDNQIGFIRNDFVNWIYNELRSRKRTVVKLQDEFVYILNEIADSYFYLGTLVDAPDHIIPVEFYHYNGHSINVSGFDASGELFHVINKRDEWILCKLRRLVELHRKLDQMSME